MDYDFNRIEAKWQDTWARERTFRTDTDPAKPKLYCLEMFPYPSGSGLHVGHLKNYVPMDAFCRFQAMKGCRVLHPMGWDAFGQPAENEAIKRGRNPREMVPEYAATYRNTLKKIGCSYDWEREINSSEPDYYRWTQWFFLLLYKRGLAYRSTAPINWCPACKTGLANEEVKEGRCWRCDTPVEKKPMPQWFFRITAYADRLLADLDGLNWSDGMKEMQRNWIGRSQGAEVDFPVIGGAQKIRVFTTRPDTLFGATFLVLAPEHPLVPQITTPDRQAAVNAYVRKAQSESEIERMNAERVKTGTFTGAFASNPVNGARVPIWIADYVLTGYGTGAIMAVPGHDARDFEFATTHKLPIVRVVSADGSDSPLTRAEAEEGIAVNSGRWSGLPTADFKEQITAWLEEQKLGQGTVNYRLRDWLISRQRYWGAPIPIVHCPQCGEVPVPEDQLPVLLPEVEQYHPSGTGESPLATIREFVETSCPCCGGPAKRETDTMGGYACSSWYFFRFADPHNQEAFASRQALDQWLPVDLYAGGIEHARSHLLYSRFWTKVLYDEGLIGFQEPFLTLRNQGSLLANTPGRRPRTEANGGAANGDSLIDWIVLKPEERKEYPAEQVVWRWARMSKSRGNVVTPDEIAARYGADSLRVYEMFVAPFEDDVMWTEEGIAGSHRFLTRVWRWLHAAMPHARCGWQGLPPDDGAPEKTVRRKLHQTIRKVGEDLEHFQFNTAIAALMELFNEVFGYAPVERETLPAGVSPRLVAEIAETLTLLISPFAPHLAEDVWHDLGHDASVVKTPWPVFDPTAIAAAAVTVMVQVNGKIRDKVEVPPTATEEEVRAAALASEKTAAQLKGKTLIKAIYVPGKMLSLVIR